MDDRCLLLLEAAVIAFTTANRHPPAAKSSSAPPKYEPLRSVDSGCKNRPCNLVGSSKHLRPSKGTGLRFHPCHFRRPSRLVRPVRSKFLRRPHDDEGSWSPRAQNPSETSWSRHRPHQ